jgi:hypothetical protein
MRPGIAVVRMSGFSGTVELLPDDHARQAFLQKPFTVDALARAVRTALSN